MSPRRLVSVAVATGFLTTGMACDDPLSPADVAGTYVLRTVDDESPPAVIWEDEGMVMRLLAGSLQLNDDGIGTEIWVYEVANALGTRSHSWEEQFQFEIHDRRLEGVYICPPSVACLGIIRPIRGVFTLRGVQLDISKQGPGDFEYVRADE